MPRFGYTMMCEQARPDRLVRDVQLAEEAGFDFSVISDHYQPWLQSQGHSGYAWSILGAAAHATERIPTQFVAPDDVAGSLSCGPDVDEHVEAINAFIDAGFDEVALVQIGGEVQQPFIAWAERELLPALRSL